MNRIVSAISSRLSLRKPQKESLEILAEVIEHFGLNKQNDPQSLNSHFAPSRQKSGGFFYLPVE